MLKTEVVSIIQNVEEVNLLMLLGSFVTLCIQGVRNIINCGANSLLLLVSYILSISSVIRCKCTELFTCGRPCSRDPGGVGCGRKPAARDTDVPVKNTFYWSDSKQMCDSSWREAEIIPN